MQKGSGDKLRQTIEAMLMANTTATTFTAKNTNVPFTTAPVTTHLETPLLRPRMNDSSAGLYAYFLPQHGSDLTQSQPLPPQPPNVRATRLSMACGLLSLRFYGPVILVRQHAPQPHFVDVTTEDLIEACACSPDLRNTSSTPTWLTNAARQNYHDAAAILQMAKIFASSSLHQEVEEEEEQEGSDSSTSDSDEADDSHPECTSYPEKSVVAKTPLCLHCRRPTENLCSGCQGGYFCLPPRTCRQLGWSHDCLCTTWRRYTDRRTELSTFSYLGDWQSTLIERPFQVSEEYYADWLKLRRLGVVDRQKEEEEATTAAATPVATSWWRTETDGWAGGQSASAIQVDARVRRTYQEGFAPLPVSDIPTQCRVTLEDWKRVGLHESINDAGLWKLSSWEDYYRLRQLPSSSPVALLCTFPLTVYHAIVQYGEVHVTVARMLKRPLRIHLVGAEKELHMLDLFQEIGFLLPGDLKAEIVFVVRKDMLPPAQQTLYTESPFLLQVELASNLTVGVVGGTYGDKDSLDPNFDFGQFGPPDMVMALNAGLYAYDSWRNVVEYLERNTGVVGIFTDYNEHSGLNCAALGGAESRESLVVNPFRQPRAMPVYSMNLPQFSNSFFYVFNRQRME